MSADSDRGSRGFDPENLGHFFRDSGEDIQNVSVSCESEWGKVIVTIITASGHLDVTLEPEETEHLESRLRAARQQLADQDG